jgi:hypothetical protein
MMWLIDEPMAWIMFFLGLAFALFFGNGDEL